MSLNTLNMAGMYAKVFSQIYDGTLCTRGPWQALVTFQQLLILADQDGNVDMTAEAIARRTTIPLDIIKTGIEVLSEPDEHSRTPTEQGRRIIPLSEGRGWGWKVVNYTHYRAIKREEDRRDYHREYWHKRKLNNSTSPQQAQPNQPIAETEAKTETKTKKTKPAAVPPPDGVSDSVWNDFLEVRKMKKAKVTPTAIAGIAREAEKAGLSLERALTMCCERGWAGFEARWVAGDKAVQASITVPGPLGPDPELLRIEADRRRAEPMPENIRQRLQELRGRV